jgi:putative Holliday junction resolvase
VVVGLPLTLDGGRGPAAEAAEEVVAALRARLEPNAVPVVTHDERLTTVVAERSLRAGGRSNRRRRSVVDQAAATVLLQSWLDRQRTVTHVGGAGDGTDPAAGSR